MHGCEKSGKEMPNVFVLSYNNNNVSCVSVFMSIPSGKKVIASVLLFRFHLSVMSFCPSPAAAAQEKKKICFVCTIQYNDIHMYFNRYGSSPPLPPCIILLQ